MITGAAWIGNGETCRASRPISTEEFEFYVRVRGYMDRERERAARIGRELDEKLRIMKERK